MKQNNNSNKRKRDDYEEYEAVRTLCSFRNAKWPVSPENSVKDEQMIEDNVFTIHCLSPGTIEKGRIHEFLKSILHLDFSKLVLTDITFQGDVWNFTVVGRPKVSGSSKKQMCHVIPYSFVKLLINEIVAESNTSKEILEGLTKVLTLFAQNYQQGYSLNSVDLETDKYSDILDRVNNNPPSRTLQKNDNDILFYSPKKGQTLFNTPTREQKAKSEFPLNNVKYIKAAMQKFSNIIDDHNTEINVSEALARFIFIMFNQGEHTAFAKEGNTARYEIRLYNSKSNAKNPKGKHYDVVTAKELQEMPEDNISECIRIVNCEGSRIKEVAKGLKNLDNIIKIYNKTNNISSYHIQKHNDKYNFTVKLANYTGDISEYDKNIKTDTCQEQMTYHIAKLLYDVFDLHALEDAVLAPSRKGTIKLYASASGKRLTKYKFKDGDDYRDSEINGAKGYSNDNVFRNEKKDLQILPEKLAELFIIGTMAFDGFQAGFKNSEVNFLNTTLKKLIELAAMDYYMDNNNTKQLEKTVLEKYNLLCPADDPDHMNVDTENLNLLIGDNVSCFDMLT